MSDRSPAPITADASLFESIDDGVVIATQWSSGPWNPDHCHGAPPSALLVRAVEQMDSEPWQLSRITIELQRPVPVGRPIRILTEVERPGSRISIVSASLVVDDTTVARARALRIRLSDAGSPGVLEQVPPMERSPDESTAMVPTFITDAIAYATDSCEYRFVSGAWGEFGASDVWIRLKVPVVHGEAPSSAQRVAGAADFGNGVSAGVDHLSWLYINPDLTIHLSRPPSGEWIGLCARSLYGDKGSGVAFSHLHDANGPIGISAQSLLVEPR